MEIAIKLKDKKDKIECLICLCEYGCDFNVNGLLIKISYSSCKVSFYEYLASMKNKGLIDSLVIQHTKKKKTITLDYIQDVVCKYYSMTIDELHSITRKREIVQARQICHYFAKKLTKESLATIGSQIGGKGHSTCIHSAKVVNNLMETDKFFKQQIEEIERKIQGL